MRALADLVLYLVGGAVAVAFGVLALLVGLAIAGAVVAFLALEAVAEVARQIPGVVWLLAAIAAFAYFGSRL